MIRRSRMRWLCLGVVTGCVAMGTSGLAAIADRGAAGATAPESAPATVQTTCPVMTGNAIDPNISTVYEGKRVYFCCTRCKAAFEEEPAKYLARLPQFTESAGQGDGHTGHEHATAGFTARALIEPMGIATLVLVAVTVGLGFLRKLNPRLLLTWHKRVGPVALAAGAIHAALVILSH